MGKITLKVREISESKGIKNPFALSQATGINYAICYRLWHSQQRRIDIGTLEKLCDWLKVLPGKLFKYDRE
jgi:DNA-binding Xre family transcriptional regulator